MNSLYIFRPIVSPAKKNVRLSVELSRMSSIFIIFIESNKSFNLQIGQTIFSVLSIWETHSFQPNFMDHEDIIQVFALCMPCLVHTLLCICVISGHTLLYISESALICLCVYVTFGTWGDETTFMIYEGMGP